MKLSIERLLLIILGLVIIYLSTCRTTPGAETESNDVHYIDTLGVWTDTLGIWIDTVEHKNLPVYINDTTTLLTPPDTSAIYHTYTSKIVDSLLNGLITVKAQNQPFIDFKYTPKQFQIKTKIVIRDSVYHKEVKSFMSVGSTVLGSKNTFGFVPQLMYNHKKGSSFVVGYDLINHNLHFSFYRKISFK